MSIQAAIKADHVTLHRISQSPLPLPEANSDVTELQLTPLKQFQREKYFGSARI